MGGYMHPSPLLAATSAALLLAATMPQLAQAREIVGFSDPYSSGTVVVKTNERALYYVLGNGKAVRYPVGVGRRGKQWTGTAFIASKQLRPAWSPPAEVKHDKPSLPDVIAGGSPSNPMGAAALTLSGGGEYAIHGTDDPGSIGGFVSYGCIRLLTAEELVENAAAIGPEHQHHTHQRASRHHARRHRQGELLGELRFPSFEEERN